MAQLREGSLAGLTSAAAREAQAADRLAETLRRANRAMEELDSCGLEAALGEARRQAETLAQAAAACATLTQLAVRAARLADDATLAQLGEVLGPDGGAEVREVARALGASLEELGIEAAARGIAARYGAALWRHLAGLCRAGAGFHAPYGPQGLLKPGAASLGRQA